MFLSGFISLFFHRGVHISFYPSLLSRRWLRWHGEGYGKKDIPYPLPQDEKKKGLYVWPRALKWAESDLWWEVGRGES